VFLSVNTKVLDANGAVLDDLNSDSEVMGDTWQLPGRVQAGSASARGGIVSGDKFPWAQPAIRQNGLNTTLRVPPYVIWEGDLPSGRMVFITPTIWEWDPGAGAWDGWLAWQKQTDQKYGQRAKDIFGKIWPVSSPVFDAVSLGIQTFASLAGLWSPLGQSLRRPIGLQRDPANPDGSLFNPYTLALSHETAEYLVTGNPQGLGAGTRELSYVDDPFLRGVYSIYLQIEKLMDPGATWPDGSVVRESSRPEVYVIFGHAKFRVPDPDTLFRLYGGWSAVQVIPDGSLSEVDDVPDDGTLLREEHDAPVWRIEGGQKRHVTSPTVLARFGGWSNVRIVPDSALASLPLGAPIT
jgi:hypothetical protein